MRNVTVFGVLLAVLVPTMVFGQISLADEKPRVAVVPLAYVNLKGSEIFDSSEDGVKAFAEAATQKVIDAFVSLDRFDVLDRTAVEAILQEQDFQMSDVVNFDTGVELGQIKGADIICVGQLQNVSTVAHYKDKVEAGDGGAEEAVTGILTGLFGSKPAQAGDENSSEKELVGYSAVVEIQIKVSDVSTGSIIMSEDVKGDTKFAQSGLGSLVEKFEDSPSKAAFEALHDAKSRMKKELREAFPAEGKIVEIIHRKKGKERFLVSIGSSLGAKKGDKLIVIQREEIELDGKIFPREKKIAKLEIRRIEADGYFSQAKAKKDGKKILKLLDAGEELIVRTKE